MPWPRVPVLPDPNEDIRVLGVPAGRLFWLGPLLLLPLLLATFLMSFAGVASLVMALVFLLALYTFLGLDLWRHVYWAVTWWLRLERRGVVLAREVPAGSPLDAGALVLVAPPAVEYTDPESLWRRWGDALRRALRRGATVQVVTWVEPDWDVARWERERRSVLRTHEGGLQDLAAQRWVLHRNLSVAAGRRTVHAVRVLSGAGAAGETAAALGRHLGAALAGAGTWTIADQAAATEHCCRGLDWSGWFRSTGGGTPALTALWQGRSDEDHTNPPEVNVETVSNAVDKSNEDDLFVEDVGAEGGKTEPPLGEKRIEDAVSPSLSEPESPIPPPEGAGGEWEKGESEASTGHGGRVPPFSSLATALDSLRVLGRYRRQADPSFNAAELPADAPEQLERPTRPLIALWSPAPAGKTTVAVELAAALARGGVSVALLDLDTRSRAMGGRLAVPPRTAALSAALATRPIDPLPDPVQVWQGVDAFVDAPDAPPIGEWSLWRLSRLLAAGAPGAEWWVVDLPANGPLVPLVLEAAWVVVLVSDPDWSRLGEVRRAYREWTQTEKPVLVVVNRWADQVPGLPHAQPDEVLGVKPASVVPMDPSVYAAAVTGAPAAASSEAIRKSLDELALAVGQAIMAQAMPKEGDSPV